ncbi:hypothetical protein MUK42_17131 [Musa troglodytarum]|uniref:Uncharacterized protein n=1 Tax=Musa troglodytarum TaxID=320322 RepID=A0A9E7HZ05_9LILI|nr:hypothetical protein MUK42_17131 [Musa troglodytarum]
MTIPALVTMASSRSLGAWRRRSPPRRLIPSYSRKRRSWRDSPNLGIS